MEDVGLYMDQYCSDVYENLGIHKTTLNLHIELMKLQYPFHIVNFMNGIYYIITYKQRIYPSECFGIL